MLCVSYQSVSPNHWSSVVIDGRQRDSSMKRNRNAWECLLFDDSCDIKVYILPIHQGTIKFYEWTCHKIKYEMETKKEPNYKELKTIVVVRVENIWEKTSIPIVERKRVKEMLKLYHLKDKNLLKSYSKIPDKKLKEFRRSSMALFDISTNKYKDISK